MWIRYPWPLLDILDPFRNSASKSTVFCACFRPCYPIIVLLLIFPVNLDMKPVTEISVPNLILGHIHTPEFLFSI